jgi:hypothetical protein
LGRNETYEGVRIVRALGIKRGIQSVFSQSARPSDGAKRNVKIVLKVVTTENYSGVGSLGETKATDRSGVRDQLSDNITRCIQRIGIEPYPTRPFGGW